MVLPIPAKGLENNPGTDGVIINDTHPYFPSSCGKCPFYKPTFKNRMQRLFFNKEKDCNNCPYIATCLDREEERLRIKERRTEIKREAKLLFADKTFNHPLLPHEVVIKSTAIRLGTYFP